MRASSVRPAASGLWRVLAAGLGYTMWATLASAQPDAYSGAEIRARVVDAETQQPLAGVHVVAQSKLDQLLTRQKKLLHSAEAVTDAKGEFHIPKWGPIPRPTFARLWGGDPRLNFFKPGYEPLTRGNAFAPDDRPVRVSQWHDRVVALKPFRGTPELWTRLIVDFQSTLDWAEITSEVSPRVNDYWKLYPRMVLAIVEERRRVPNAVRYQILPLDLWQITEDELRAAASAKEGSP
jgi:hypothetical protein